MVKKDILGDEDFLGDMDFMLKSLINEMIKEHRGKNFKIVSFSKRLNDSATPP